MARNHCSCNSLSSSKFSFTESSDAEKELGRRKRLRDRGHYSHHQVDDLCDDLSEGNQTMRENERLMSDFRDTSMRQRDEIHKLRRDLDHSRELLHHCSDLDSPPKCYHRNRAPNCVKISGTCNCCHCQQLAVGMERVAVENSNAKEPRTMDLLNSSLSKPWNNVHVDSQLESLSSDIKSLKSELLEAQLGVNKTESVTASMESRVSDIETKVKEGTSHGVSERQLRELSEEIKSIKEDLLMREATLAQQRMLDDLKDLESQLWNECEAHGSCRMEVERLTEQVSRLQVKIQHMQKEKKEVTCRCTELEHEVAQCRASSEADHNKLLLLKHENADLKIKCHSVEKKFKLLSSKYRRLESQRAELMTCREADRTLVTKYEDELSKLQSGKEMLMREISALQQDLSQVTNQASFLTEQAETERTQHEGDVEKLTTHHSSLAKKLKQLVVLCKSLKTELSSTQNELSQLRNEKNKTEEEIKKTQQSFVSTEQDLQQQIKALKMAHRQELDSLVQEHNRLLTRMKLENSHLQVQLSDEQSTVRAVRIQQKRALEDQQKMVDEDLSRSLKDSERVRHKYMKTKKYFKDKMSKLQKKLDASKDEEQNGVSRYLSLSQEAVTRLTDEQNTMLKALAFEVDILVDKLSARVDMPEYLTLPSGIGSSTKTLFADLLTKTQWLKREVVELVAQEETLRAFHVC